jgi:hypothetical protein
VLGLGQKVGTLTRIKASLPRRAGMQQLFAPAVECTLKTYRKGHCLGRQYLLVTVSQGETNVNAGANTAHGIPSLVLQVLR